jgi:hypothetical protein
MKKNNGVVLLNNSISNTPLVLKDYQCGGCRELGIADGEANGGYVLYG